MGTMATKAIIMILALEVRSENEVQMLTEALSNLRARKVDAMESLNNFGPRLENRPWAPRDFGIPTIDSLLGRLQDETVDV